MENRRFNVILEDNHLLAADKPAGLPSQPDSSGDPSLDILAKEYLKRKYNKPGEVYLGLVHRLDRPTSGVVLMARTDKAAGRLADQFRRRTPVKLYLALVECHARPENAARLADVLSPLANGGMRLLSGGTPGKADRKAELSYRLLKTLDGGKRALLLVNLQSGVKHQIRCQLAARGLTVVGDFRYGPFGKPASPVPVADGRAILLHAARLDFTHPVRREPVTLTAPPPAHWTPFLAGETVDPIEWDDVPE